MARSSRLVEALVRLVRNQAPALVVLSGDITQRARRRQLRAALAFVDRLGAPATLAIPYANHCREFDANLEPVFEFCPMVLTILMEAASLGRRVGKASSLPLKGHVAHACT